MRRAGPGVRPGEIATWLGLVAAVLVSFAPRATATHAVNHRYLVLGYVRDAVGEPIRHVVVRVVREKTGLAYEARTGADGFYRVIVHLHDDDVLDPLLVNVGRAAIRIEARFNPLNVRRHRGTRVDFIAGKGRERQDTFTDTVERYLKE